MEQNLVIGEYFFALFEFDEKKPIFGLVQILDAYASSDFAGPFTMIKREYLAKDIFIEHIIILDPDALVQKAKIEDLSHEGSELAIKVLKERLKKNYQVSKKNFSKISKAQEEEQKQQEKLRERIAYFEHDLGFAPDKALEAAKKELGIN